MTLIVIVIPELNSGQALMNPPAGGLIFDFFFRFPFVSIRVFQQFNHLFLKSH